MTIIFNKFKILAASLILSASLVPTLNAQQVIGNSSAQSANRVIVFDGSGSMWGQIEGRAKIEIAKEVVSNLLDDLNPDDKLGLVAYGHRVKGECSDIETLVSPRSNSLEDIRRGVRSITPRGKTPLSAAVKEAAQQLRHEEDAATVILISDGKETCDLDPCAIGRELEQSGVDFTAHVVGFDIADPNDIAQLRCLADTTGGQYLSASNADELSSALEEINNIDPIAPSEDDFGPIEVENVVFFEDDFDGDSLKPHWIIENDTPVLYEVKNSQYIASAAGKYHEFTYEGAPNRLILDKELPSSDFDLVLDFDVHAQNGQDYIPLGLYTDAGNQLVAWFHMERGGCGYQPKLKLSNIQTRGEGKPEETVFETNIFTEIGFNACTKGQEDIQNKILDFITMNDNTKLILRKTGRDYHAVLETIIPAFGNKAEQEISFKTEAFKLIRPPKNAMFMVSKSHTRQEETILKAKRFAIEVKE